MNPLRRTPNPLLFQIPVRPWLRRVLAAGEKRSLEAVPGEELDRIRDRGFHGVWLMGVWRTGPEGRRLALQHEDLRQDYDRFLPGWTEEDVDGSPYSILEYEPGPGIGGFAALEHFRERLHSRGLGLMLDFVPNHLGRDHAWTDEHPERLIQGTADDLRKEPHSWFEHESADGTKRVFAHGRDPHFLGWSDTVQVEHRRAETRGAMTDLLKDLAGRCDALRCDVAMLLLEDVFRKTWGERPDGERGDFWTEAITELRGAGHDTVLMAEAYWGLEPWLVKAGFDFAYDKGLYDELLAGDLPAVRRRLADGASVAHGAHFLENHDEVRALDSFGEHRLRAGAAVTFSLPGLRLFHEGQDEGRRIRIPVQLSREPDEPVLDWVRDFHERLWQILRSPVFHEGAWRPLDIRPAGDGGDTPPLVGSEWTRGHERYAVVANFSEEAARGRVPLSLRESGPSPLRLRDELSGDDFERDRNEMREPGLFVELAGWGVHFLRVEDPPG